MRTTVDIEDDLLDKLRAEATRGRVPFKHLLNRLLRAGLEGHGVTRTAYRCPTFGMGAPAGDLDKALGIAATLDDDAVRRKLDLRK